MRTIRDCNVAVVGGAGFLGSHLTNYLIDDRGCNVVVVDNLVAGRREFVHPKARFVHHDITGSEEFLLRLFHADGSSNSDDIIEYVFNYAAYPYIPDSFARPIHVCNVNFMGAMKVINAAQEAGCQGVLQVSSAEIYGEGTLVKDSERVVIDDGGQIDESALVVPHSSYGAAKAAIDAWIQVRWREARTPCIALRQFNCCGERETHPYVVPEIISQLAKQICRDDVGDGMTTYDDRPRPGAAHGVVRLGNNSFRDFLYAGDAVRIAVELLERGQFGEVYNLGSETGIKMYDLAKLIGRVMGFADVRVEEDAARKRPWEIWSLLSDDSKINSVVGSKPTVSLEEALHRTVRWFEDQGRKWPWEKQ